MAIVTGTGSSVLQSSGSILGRIGPPLKWAEFLLSTSEWGHGGPTWEEGSKALNASGRNCKTGLFTKHPDDASCLPRPCSLPLVTIICTVSGVLERFGMFSYGRSPNWSRRDRHLRLKFQHLVTALQEFLPLQVGWGDNTVLSSSEGHCKGA